MSIILMLFAMGAVSTPNKTQLPRLRNPAAVITYQDYPEVAQRRSEYGVVSVMLNVSAEGKVISCAVTETSGSELLDNRTCVLFRARARFDPAVDGNGAPISAKYPTAVSWGNDTKFSTTKIEFDLKVSRIPSDYQFPLQAKVIFDAGGRASACDIVQSSGSVMADQLACRQIRQRLAIPAPKSSSSSVPPAAVRSVVVTLLPQSPAP